MDNLLVPRVLAGRPSETRDSNSLLKRVIKNLQRDNEKVTESRVPGTISVQYVLLLPLVNKLCRNSIKVCDDKSSYICWTAIIDMTWEKEREREKSFPTQTAFCIFPI